MDVGRILERGMSFTNKRQNSVQELKNILVAQASTAFTKDFF